MNDHDKTKDQLIEELRIHQIELEMQNEERKRAYGELEKSRNRFSDFHLESVQTLRELHKPSYSGTSITNYT